MFLCTTWELSLQVLLLTEEDEAPLGYKSVCVFKGMPRHGPLRKLAKKQAEIEVSTKGLIDSIEANHLAVIRMFYRVLDEVEQMPSIVNVHQATG